MARIVVVGASQGGVQALRALVAALPREFTAPLLIVQHIGASPSLLPSILTDANDRRAAFGKHGEAVRRFCRAFLRSCSTGVSVASRLQMTSAAKAKLWQPCDHLS